MSHSSTPKLGADYLVEGQAGGETSFNETLNILDTVIHPSVLDKDESTPPGSPSNGDAYIIPPASEAAATDDWEGQEDSIAAYHDGWIFITPQDGWRVFVADEDRVYRRVDGAWDATLQLPSYNDASRPSPSTAGRMIWNTDDDMINIDDGANWTLPDGTTT